MTNFNNPNTEEDTFTLLKKTIKQSNKQGNQLQQQGQVLEEIVEKMGDMYVGMENMYVEIKSDIKELKNNKTLNDAQQYKLKDETAHVMGRKFAKEFLGNDYFRVSYETRKKFHGKFYRKIWSKLKKEFSVPRWYLIKDECFDEAIDFVKNLKLTDFNLQDI